MSVLSVFTRSATAVARVVPRTTCSQLQCQSRLGSVLIKIRSQDDITLHHRSNSWPNSGGMCKFLTTTAAQSISSSHLSEKDQDDMANLTEKYPENASSEEKVRLRLEAAAERVPLVLPEDAIKMYGKTSPEHVVFIDLREPPEWAETGLVRNAIPCPRGVLEFVVSSRVWVGSTVIVYCSNGYRAALAGDVLLDMGYKKVLNGGGFDSLRVRIRLMHVHIVSWALHISHVTYHTHHITCTHTQHTHWACV
eukprot:m.171179 g.171179  ORF g.171179 m.171179 type:complete len:251 (-) comp18281_c0_seq2:105-857(-)